MKKTILSILLLAACLMCARAETIILRTGARVRGTIVFQNEEVVVVRDESGARFQFPRAEVQDIIGDEAASVEDKEQPAKVQEMAVAKKATVLFELAGGVAYLPSDTVGGAFSVDMLVGSHKINGKRIFVGAGVGYHGLFVGGEKRGISPDFVANCDDIVSIPYFSDAKFSLPTASTCAIIGFEFGKRLSKDKKV